MSFRVSKTDEERNGTGLLSESRNNIQEAEITHKRNDPHVNRKLASRSVEYL